MRRVAAAGLMMACGARAPEPLPAVTPSPKRADTAPIAGPIHAPRPAIALRDPHPDLTEEPRWPLSMSQHPTLEPQFNVAGVLADPGISWTELCARGVQLRRDPAHRDELAYLGGWCAAEQHDVTTAVTALAPLRDSSVPGIANGAAFDIVNMLVASLDADHAIELLTDLKIRDAHLYDMLAAAYFEVGKDDDAVRATSTAMQVDGNPVVASTCHRLARMVLLGSEGWRPKFLEQLGNLATPTINDAVCQDLDTSLRCVIEPPGDCRGYWARQGMTPVDAEIAAAYDRWDHPRDWFGWMLYADGLGNLTANPAAKDMALAAVDAGIVASECSDNRLRQISRELDQLAAHSKAPELAAKTKQLTAFVAQPAACSRFREQWLADHPQ